MTVTENFEVSRGLRQRDPVATTLYNIILESVLRKSGLQIEKSIRIKSQQCFTNVDDVKRNEAEKSNTKTGKRSKDI